MTSLKPEKAIPNSRNHGYNIREATLYSSAGYQMSKSDVKNLQCPLCEHILQDPIQLITCGCRYCQRCVDVLMANRSQGDLKCLVDSTPFSKKNVRKDRGCVKEINLIEMDCPNQCSWHGLLIQFEGHIADSCPREPVQCPNGCGETYPRSEQSQHSESCLKQPIDCEYCEKTVTKDTLELHLSNMCQGYPMTCDYCHGSIATRREYPKHLEDDCTEYDMDCPVKGLFHCEFKGKRPQVTEHVQQHMIGILEKFSSACNKMEDLANENERIRESNAQLEKSSREKDDLITKLDERLRNLEMTVRHGARMSRDEHVTPDIVETDNVSKERSVVKVKGHTGASKGEKVTTDGVSNRQIGNLKESNEANKMQITQLSQSVQNLQQSMTQQSIAVDELRLRQDILDVKTTNGIFVWKIPDIRRRYREAIDRRTVSIYSPPYFTSPQGYRMCTRVYLNGDGIGKGTHISVFFVLMRSECDNLLQWPFKQSVRFTLINQNNASASITEAFAPDLQSPSFKQPTTDMNIASGFPKFAKQSVLQDDNFTKGNTIYIKAQVDLSGLPAY